MSRNRIPVLVTALFCAAGVGSAADARAAELFYGVDAGNGLVTFSGQTPASIKRTAFTGLPASEQIVGLDVRPANKQVVAVGSTSRLYRIDVATGAATAIGSTAFTPGLAGTSFGLTCSEGCTLSARILSGSRVVGGGKPITTDLAGSAPLRLVFRTAAKKEFAARRTVAFTVVVTARDAAGNTATARQTVRATR